MSQGRHITSQRHTPSDGLSDHRGFVMRLVPATSPTAAELHEQAIEQECRGDLVAAIQSYREALRIGGPDAQIVFDLAYALAAAGNIDPAIERYSQVIELDAKRQDAWNNLGDLLLTAGQTEAGLDALQHAVRLDPSDPVARYNFDLAVDQIDERLRRYLPSHL